MSTSNGPARETEPIVDPQTSAVSGLGRSEPYARLVWRGFKRHRLAVFGLVVLGGMLVFGVFAQFLAPNPENERVIARKFAPPQRIHWGDDGRFRGPFVYDLMWQTDPFTGLRTYQQDKSKILPIRLFVPAEPYRLWGIFPLRVRLFGVTEGVWYPFGGDDQGRDLLSRCIYAARISLGFAFLGAFLTVILGTAFGIISGFYGGPIDVVFQRVTEVIISFPRIPLWMALAAALPTGWSPAREFLLIAIVLSLVGWGGLARQIRGLVLSLRDSDYVLAATALAASDNRIMFVHLLPNILGLTIVNATIIIPVLILGETALSFLGLGLRPPANSWGVLLKNAQSVTVIEQFPWLLIPGAFVILAILAFNYIGDGLRDAIDPHNY